MRNIIHNVHMKVPPHLACSLVCGMSVVFTGCSGCFTDCPPLGCLVGWVGLKRRWLAMTLTVTGTAVFRVGRLMCTDSTTITGTAFQDQAQSYLFPVGSVLWAYLTCLFKEFECLGCTARDVEIQSKLSE